MTSAWKLAPSAVLDKAKCATSTCQVCKSKIQVGQVRMGMIYNHKEGFMLMEWVHLSCTSYKYSMNPLGQVQEIALLPVAG